MPAYFDKKYKTWTARYYIQDETGKFVQRNKRGFQSKKSALKYIDTQLLNDQSFLYDPTFEEVFESYLQLNNKGANEETQAGKRTKFNKLLYKNRNRKVSSFTALIISQQTNFILNSDYSNSYKKIALSIFKATLIHAYLYYDIKTKYELIRSHASLKTPSKIKAPSMEELELILSHESNLVYQIYYRFIARTGLRRGESLGIKKSNVKDNEIIIEQAYRKHKIGKTKNIYSNRTIYIDNGTHELIKPLLEIKGKYLFGGHSPLRPDTCSRRFSNYCKIEGLPYSLHDLRHTHATILLNQGAPLTEVSKRLGHSSPSTTLSVYSHVSLESQKILASKLDEIFNK